MQENKPKPMVSVLMITYNHEKYIEEAVRSVMMQETDFDYELIIGEDCSTDRTREIVLALKEEFPDKIRLLLHEQNIGMIPNMVATYNACTGKYIALCEGDDYWIDPKKLQIQVDYMEANPDCRICWHSYNIVDNKGKLLETRDCLQYDSWGLLENLASDFIKTPTTIFNRPLIQIPDWINGLKASGDWPLFTWLLLQGGELCFLNAEPMTIYRLHPGGVTASTKNSDPKTRNLAKKRYLMALKDITLVSQHIPNEMRADLRNRQYRVSLALARLFIEEENYFPAYRYIFRAMINSFLASRAPSQKPNKLARLKKLLKLILRRK